MNGNGPIRGRNVSTILAQITAGLALNPKRKFAYVEQAVRTRLLLPASSVTLRAAHSGSYCELRAIHCMYTLFLSLLHRRTSHHHFFLSHESPLPQFFQAWFEVQSSAIQAQVKSQVASGQLSFTNGESVAHKKKACSALKRITTEE